MVCASVGLKHIALSVGFGFALMLPSPSEQANAQTHDDQAEKSIGREAQKPNPATPEQPVTLRPDQGCERGKDDRKSDLCAQWKAADAANEAAGFGFWQLVIGWIGLVLGAVTMAAAIAAAWFAKQAADHTKVGSDAAEEAGRMFLEAERGILRVQKAEMGKIDGVVSLVISVKNIGRTSARIVRFGSALRDDSEPRWIDVPAGSVAEVAGLGYPKSKDVVVDEWFWIEYETLKIKNARTNFKIRMSWFDGGGYAMPKWSVRTTNANGHSDDT